MLRIAVPNKGSLSESASAMLGEAGYRQRRDSRELVLVDPENEVEFFFLRPRDIAIYVGSGTLDVGITGRALLLDAEVEAAELMALGFGGSTFRFAGPAGTFSAEAELEGKRIATSYAGLLEQHLKRLGLHASVVRLDGAVESSIRLGVADAVADVVSTGTTLRTSGLEVFGEPILVSDAVLIGRRGADPHPGIDVLIRRLHGVLVARRYVLMDYDIRRELVDQASALTPGLESPTVSPLRDSDWVAVRVMVPRKDTNNVMDKLYGLGARAILVSSIEACRL